MKMFWIVVLDLPNALQGDVKSTQMESNTNSFIHLKNNYSDSIESFDL